LAQKAGLPSKVVVPQPYLTVSEPAARVSTSAKNGAMIAAEVAFRPKGVNVDSGPSNGTSVQMSVQRQAGP